MSTHKVRSGHRLGLILLVTVVGAFALTTALFGWPRDAEAAGGFAGFIGALLSPASLMLLVLPLGAQSTTE